MDNRSHTWRLVGAVLLAVSLFGFVASEPRRAWGEEPLRQQVLVDKATLAMDRLANDPDMDWADAYVKRAKGVLIIPDFYKAGFIIGGAAGRGVALIKDEKTGEWSPPAFYTIGSGSVGLQIGAKVSEVFVLAVTDKGRESFYGSSFKLGGEVSMAAGPVGASAEGAKAPSLEAVDYITIAYSKGAFAGLSLEGAVITSNYEWNKSYYAKPVRAMDILISDLVDNPNSDELQNAVARATR